MTINFKIPASWAELSDSQMIWLLSIISKDYSSDEVRLKALLRFSGTRLIARRGTGTALLKQGKQLFEVTSLQLAEILPLAAHLSEVPPYPARPSRLFSGHALPEDFRGVPFGSFIEADNLFQGYLHTQRTDLIDALASILWQGIKLRPARMPIIRTAALFWFIALKTLFSRKFPDFFVPVSGDAQPPNPEAAMNAQLRALTKGDPTREKDILALDTWRALAELDAQAAEYKLLNNKLKSKSPNP